MQTWFFIFLVVGVVVIALMANAAQRKGLNETYWRVAEHYGGTLYEAGLFARPKIQFEHADAEVTIDIYTTGGERPVYYTQAHFRGIHPTTRCEVYPEGMWSRIGKLIGMADIDIGSPDFDERYVIKGDEPAQISTLLSPAVQNQIDELRQLLGNNNIYVSFNPSKLLIKKLSYIRDYHTLLKFTKLATALYDLTVALPEGALTIVKQSKPMEEDAICQICGESITQQRVLCRQCKTPHHLDCWQYYGACSTYGCQETRHTRPRPQSARR